MAHTKIIIFVSVILMTSLACNFLTSSKFLDQKLKPSKPLYTISGTLNPAKEITVPGNTRVLVLWMVLPDSAGYDYIFGEGTVNFENYAFTINFDGPPPPEALNKINDTTFGVGFVILTGNQKLDGKIDRKNFPADEIIGISANYAVIYVDGSFENVPNTGWINNFGQGYSVGQGVDMPEGFDEFKPVAPNKIQIIIDDFKNIKFLNFW